MTHMAICCALLLWSLAYSGLVMFSFFIAGPNHWANLVADGRIKQEYADYILAIPAWGIWLSVALALIRVAAATLLFTRSTLAVWLYGAALLITLGMMYRAFVLQNVANVIRPSQIGVEIGFILISFFAVWYARLCATAVLGS